MKIDIEAIKRRCEAATAGPWKHKTGHIGYRIVDYLTCDDYDGIYIHWGAGQGEITPKSAANAEFISHARADIPALLGYITELQANEARMRGALSGMLKKRVACTESCLDCFQAFCDEYREAQQALSAPPGPVSELIQAVGKVYEESEKPYSKRLEVLCADVLAAYAKVVGKCEK